MRGLYGGAIEAELAENYADVSQFRQVPDHQEVLVDGETEISVIVELLDMDQSSKNNADSTDALSAIKNQFFDLATCNESTENSIISVANLQNEGFMPHIDDTFPKMALIGKQTVGKYRTRPDMRVDVVYIIMVLVKLTNVATDVLISMNIPSVDLKTESGEVELEQLLNVLELLSAKEGTPLSATPISKYVATLARFLDTFDVKDWGLFTPSS